MHKTIRCPITVEQYVVYALSNKEKYSYCYALRLFSDRMLCVFVLTSSIERYIIKHISVVMIIFLLKLISNKYYETNEKSNKNDITFIILKKHIFIQVCDP